MDKNLCRYALLLSHINITHSLRNIWTNVIHVLTLRFATTTFVYVSFSSSIVPPRFTSKPGDFATRLGATIRFNCSASGDPEPSISLRKDKDSSSFKHRLDLNGDTFVMTNVTVRDVGLYICSATSKAGSINTTFQINIIGKFNNNYSELPVDRHVSKTDISLERTLFFLSILNIMFGIYTRCQQMKLL